MQGRERGDRARGPEHLAAPAAEPAPQPVARLDRRQQALDVADHDLEGRRVGLGRECLRERDHAERHRVAAPHHGGAAGLAAIEPEQLGAAAADVDQEHVLGLGVDQRQAAEQREPGLVLMRQDLEAETGDPLDPRQELDAVLRPPAGLGRDAAERADVVAGDDPGADPERRDRAGDRPFAEPAALRHRLAQPDDPREAVDDLEAVGARPRHQQPTVVGPEVERSHRRRDPARRPQDGMRSRLDHGTIATVGGIAVVEQYFPQTPDISLEPPGSARRIGPCRRRRSGVRWADQGRRRRVEGSDLAMGGRPICDGSRGRP